MLRYKSLKLKLVKINVKSNRETEEKAQKFGPCAVCMDVSNIEKRSPPSKAFCAQGFSCHFKCLLKNGCKKKLQRFSHVPYERERCVHTEPLKSFSWLSGERNRSHLTVCSTGNRQNVLAFHNINNSTSSWCNSCSFGIQTT